MQTGDKVERRRREYRGAESVRGVGCGEGVYPLHCDPLISRKLLEVESRNFSHISILFSGMKIFSLVACGGRSASSVHLGPPHISETTRARKLKFYINLDGAKYSFRV